jgi:AcrR family transcriptional regulator
LLQNRYLAIRLGKYSAFIDQTALDINRVRKPSQEIKFGMPTVTQPKNKKTSIRAKKNVDNAVKMPTTEKGRRRRDALKNATATLLKKHSYHDLTLTQITDKANIPTSVFYHYFSNKRQITLELIDEIFDQFEQHLIEAGPFGMFSVGIRFANLEMLKLYGKNAGLMRCLAEVDEPEFAKQWHKHLFAWRRRIVSAMEEFVTIKSPDKGELLALAHTMSGMTETFAYDLGVNRNAELRKKFKTLEDAADFLTTLWVRALFATPPQEEWAEKFTTLASLKERDTRIK